MSGEIHHYDKNITHYFTTSLHTKKMKLISLDLSIISYENALKEILQLAHTHTPSYACFANVHMTIEAHDNPDFAQKVNKANFVFTDGKPLCLALKLKHNIIQPRIAGMDFMPDILQKANNQFGNQVNKEKLNVFLYGSTKEILEKISEKIKEKYPQINVCGSISPPFIEILEEEKQNYINQINKANTHLVFVALGCPKQEIWMSENSPQINAVLLGVGGAFPVFAQMQKRAPKILQNLALEWVFRLSQEPKRLFRRYFYTNLKFLKLLK